MGLGGDHDSSIGVTCFPPIPETGLTEVLGVWAGRGELWDALAVPEEVRSERRWNRQAIRCRAHRILLERVAPALARWPSNVILWMDFLPASRKHARVVRGEPFSGVSWSSTRLRFGWPPAAFVGREAERGADMLHVATLRWTLEQLAIVRADAVRAYPEADIGIRPQLDAAISLLAIDPVSAATGAPPGRPETMALRYEGAPWGAVAEVAEEFRAVERSVTELAWRLLLPDHAIRWRLFHLSILGVLLASLRKTGCVITSLRPVGAWARGPAYSVTDSRGRFWDLWFEASGIWTYEDAISPYIEATAGLPGAGRPLGADLLLICPGEYALVLECKYSENAEIVARDGYYQATTYAAEIRSRLARKVTSVVVGPEGVIATPSFSQTTTAEIGTLPPSGIPDLIERFLASTDAMADERSLPEVFRPSLA